MLLFKSHKHETTNFMAYLRLILYIFIYEAKLLT